MTRRERILAAMDRKPVDRIPTDLWATKEVRAKLQQHFGPEADIIEELGIDGFAGAGPEYAGPPKEYPGHDPVWGIEHKAVEYQTGVYYEQSTFPLAEAETIDDLEAFDWPDPKWFDWSTLRERLEPLQQKQAIKVGYSAILYLHNQVRGLEQSLMDPVMDPAFTHHLLEKLADYIHGFHRGAFEAAGDLIDVTEVTDDYGSQTGPLISPELFRTFYAPHVKRFIDLAKAHDIKVFHHDDGAMAPMLPYLVDMGIDLLNPVQWTCPGMDRAELKQIYGDRICFHGAVENQRILPFGTPDEVRQEVRDCIDLLAPDKTGYILASCHNLQAVSPVENILAMYDEARTYGRFD